MSKTLRISLFLLLAVLVSCHDSVSRKDNSKNEQGSLRFAFSVKEVSVTPSEDHKAEPSIKYSSLSADTDAPSAEDFQIIITPQDNTSDTSFVSRYGDLPVSVNLAEGNYTVCAEWGDRKPFVTEKPYYRAQSQCEILRRNTTEVNLTASLYGFAVDIVYNDDFKTSFSNYYIEAEINDATGNYTFGHNGAQTRAYFLPSTVRLILRGTTADGKPYSSVIKEITSAGKQIYTLRLTILPKGHTLDIAIDTQVEQIDVEGIVPDDLLPEVPPIPTHTFSYYETTNRAEGLGALTLQTAVGLSALEFSFEGQAMAGVGLSGVMSTSNTDHVAAMKTAGIAFEEGIIEAMADPSVFRKTTVIDFSTLASRLPSQGAAQTDYTIGVKVIDRLDKSASGSTTLRILPPIFTLPAVPPGSVWTSRAEIQPLQADGVAKGDFAVIGSSERLKYQLREEDGEWRDLSSLACTGLTSGKKYYARAMYGDTPSTGEVEFTTESATQLPNGNMENWWTDMLVGSSLFNYKMQRYYPWVSGGVQFWDTNNTRTCSYTATMYVNAYNSFPAVSYIYGGRSGKAVELRSISASGSGLNSKSNCVDSHKTPGKLFVGSYKYDGKDNETITPGKGFASRPTAMSFYYQYEPWGTEDRKGGDDEFRGSVTLYNGQTQIGYGEFKYRTTNRASITEWTRAEVQITYSDQTLKADRIYVEFVTSTDDKPKVSNYWERLGSSHNTTNQNDNSKGCPTLADFNYGGTMKQYYGSVLKIDDVELIYGR